jgi:hypothetical protein
VTSRMALLLCLIVVPAGSARQIPNKVMRDEYAIYSAWTSVHFAENPPERLYFSSRTGIFDPLKYVWKACVEKDGVDKSLMKQLHALGEAEYLLDFDTSGHLQIPWAYKEVDVAPDLGHQTFHLITFSRVAFNRDHTDALFAVFDHCGSQCGLGGFVCAKIQAGKWSFRPVTGCAVVS